MPVHHVPLLNTSCKIVHTHGVSPRFRVVPNDSGAFVTMPLEDKMHPDVASAKLRYSVCCELHVKYVLNYSLKMRRHEIINLGIA